MRYAASIRYGGQLIEAVDCDHLSYKHLGLLCPECKNPVLLKAGHQRTAPKSKETVSVHSAFAHFPAADPALVLQCETRVRRYNRRDLERKATAARNQRLKLLQRWFWDIFWRRLDLYQNFRDPAEVKEFQKSLPEVASIFCAWNSDLVEVIENLLAMSHEERLDQCLECIEGFSQQKPEKFSSDRIQQSVQFLSKVDRAMHALICTEVLDFLAAKSSRRLLEQVMMVFYLRATDDLSQTRSRDLSQTIFAFFILELCWTDWAGEFERRKHAA